MFNISIVIPGKNVADVIPKCIESLLELRKKYNFKEIIFVDDNSSDSTAEIVKNYPITYLTSKGLGPAHARNIGWNYSKSDFIWFIDSDCYLCPETFKQMILSFQDDSIDGVASGYLSESKKILPNILQYELEFKYRNLLSLKNANFLPSASVIYKRSLLKKLEGFNEELILGEDVDFSLRAYSQGSKLIFNTGSRVFHHHEKNFLQYLIKQFFHGYYAASVLINLKKPCLQNSYFFKSEIYEILIAAFFSSSVFLAFFTKYSLPLQIAITALILIPLPRVLATISLSKKISILFSYLPFVITRSITRSLGVAIGLIFQMISQATKILKPKKTTYRRPTLNKS